MKQGWRDKVLRYYKEFKSLTWHDAKYKFGPLGESKDIWGEILYHIYEAITEKCPFTETDMMCSYCWDYYHDMVKMLDDEGDRKYYKGLEKKHLDYMMKITKEGAEQ